MKPVTGADPRQLFDRVPFMGLLGMRREFSEGGRARLSIDPRPELGNVIGAVHGGVVLTLLDVAMASAAVSRVDFAQTAVSLNLNTNFVQPGRGVLTADGEVTAQDGTLVWCRARVTDATGALVAHADGTFRYLPLPAPAPT
jgi:uncharacterized protein (TIGR00369 family)